MQKVRALSTKGVEEEMAKLTKKQEIPHVVAADMMYACSEDEPDKEQANLEIGGVVPDILNDDTTDVRDVVYHGDLKKRF